ncbi:hypothetical protein AB685_15650 [Bacillus sp. LL01]|uniref:hypothetical protein n=1 Tax=Bacillus sp. LL01 TaxID=1665556 RepID=UPI00064D360B|nr:hypothetical protein [Bacillus sp. LL01]KMJ57452.1 hypothetical protein AB685_15650 [Bacillus sp. LL01]
MLSTGCSNIRKAETPTISINENSEYETTFNELNLGVVMDFDFHLPDADKRWVNLWVERYKDGKKDPESLTHLSYGSIPSDSEEGNLGFGMINPNAEDTMVFLYGPGVKVQPSKIDKEFKTNMISTWDYAIGKGKVKLELGKTKILAAYRESDSDTVSTVDFQDMESVERMIEQDDTVLLLKIKVEGVRD